MFPARMSLEEARQQAAFVDMQDEVFRCVTPGEPRFHEGGPRTVLLVDVGAKDGLVRSLLARGVSVMRVPWTADLARFAREVDGVLIGNGPGDPKDLAPLVAKVRGLLADERLPVFGVCLGHQILALAIGADTYKLPYGHRGVNQPVQDRLTRRCCITSQNHGYAVAEASLPDAWEPWFENINDGTNEGIRSLYHPHFSVQFHPEACPGPQDASYLFDDYLRAVARRPLRA